MDRSEALPPALEQDPDQVDHDGRVAHRGARELGAEAVAGEALNIHKSLTAALKVATRLFFQIGSEVLHFPFADEIARVNWNLQAAVERC